MCGRCDEAAQAGMPDGTDASIQARLTVYYELWIACSATSKAATMRSA